MSINNATPADWDRLREKHPALEVPKPTIDEQMKVYLNAAQEELNTAWWDQHIENLENLERRELADFNNSRDTAQEEPDTEEDAVNSPSHYNTGGVEAIQAIEASMSKEAFQGYLKGNCMKYIWRMSYKGKAKEDTLKAQWYLNRLIEIL